MKYSQFIFFICVAIFLPIVLLSEEVHVDSNLVLTRSDMWNFGFTPISIAASLSLLIAAIMAWKGSRKGLLFCAWWAFIYTLSMSIPIIIFFSERAIPIIITGIIWSTIWFVLLKSRKGQSDLTRINSKTN